MHFISVLNKSRFLHRFHRDLCIKWDLFVKLENSKKKTGLEKWRQIWRPPIISKITVLTGYHIFGHNQVKLFGITGQRRLNWLSMEKNSRSGFIRAMVPKCTTSPGKNNLGSLGALLVFNKRGAPFKIASVCRQICRQFFNSVFS